MPLRLVSLLSSLLAVAVTLVAGAVPSAAAGVPMLGISDQKASTFTDPRFRGLGLPAARLVMPWDAIFTRPASLDRWLQGARRAGVAPLVAFSSGSGQRCPADPCYAPRPAELAAAFDAFRASYPWVREFQVWNEANHETQPLFRRPEDAARLWLALEPRCAACTLVAADVLGDRTMLGWVRRFERAAGPQVDRAIWGLHNYADVNDGSTRATDTLLREVRGGIWFTETGGIVSFTTRDGRNIRPYDEQRALDAINAALDLGKEHFPRVARIYLYNWQAGPASERFDSGLVGPDGGERVALRALWRRVNGLAPIPPAPEQAVAPAASVRPTTATARVVSAELAKPDGRSTSVRVRCRAARGSCLGLVTLSGADLGRLGSGAFSVPAGTSATVPVRLSNRAARILPLRPVGTRVLARLRQRTATGAAASRDAGLRLRGRVRD